MICVTPVICGRNGLRLFHRRCCRRQSRRCHGCRRRSVSRSHRLTVLNGAARRCLTAAVSRRRVSRSRMSCRRCRGVRSRVWSSAARCRRMSGCRTSPACCGAACRHGLWCCPAPCHGCRTTVFPNACRGHCRRTPRDRSRRCQNGCFPGN